MQCAFSLLLASLALLSRASADPVACGSGRPNVIQAQNGVFTSPNHPEDYPNNANCQWRLVGQESTSRVKLQFEIFETESNYDFVNVHDGDSTSSTRIGRLSGGQRDVSLESTQQNMYVQFTSDGSVGETGFKAKFTTDLACFEGQERVIQGRDGSFTSPYFPADYGTNMECNWRLRGNSGEVVVLEFEEFELEFEPNCEWDNIEVYDSGDLVGRFCGNSTPAAYISSSNEVSVKFTMDQSIIRGGFKANYQIVDPSSTPFISTLPPTGPGGSTILPTPPPINDDIIPPVMVIAVNGTYRTDDGSNITRDCADEYILQLRYRATEMLYVLYEIGYCEDTDIYVATADVAGYTLNDQGFFKFDFNLVSGLNDTPSGLEFCAQDVLNAVTVFQHWPNPLITSVPGCPKTITDPERIDGVGTEFACPFFGKRN